MTAQDVKPSECAAARGVTEVLHFTTSKGLLGIFSSAQVLSRDGLKAAGELEPIRLLNCVSRSKDAAWTGYVNLSLSRVNLHMLSYSKSWHRDDDVWWAVLSFDVAVLDDPRVWFTTTNNTYSDVVRRGQGTAGLAALFDEPIAWGWRGSLKWRHGKPDFLPTCEQAEVLFPDALPLSQLRNIYVPHPEHLDDIASWVPAFPGVPPVPVTHRSDVFA